MRMSLLVLCWSLLRCISLFFFGFCFRFLTACFWRNKDEYIKVKRTHRQTKARTTWLFNAYRRWRHKNFYTMHRSISQTKFAFNRPFIQRTQSGGPSAANDLSPSRPFWQCWMIGEQCRQIGPSRCKNSKCQTVPCPALVLLSFCARCYLRCSFYGAK